MNQVSLRIGAALRGGTYRIDQVLGQGGFGITYLATDLSLDKHVAIKEFFPKDYCDRDSSTSHVTLGTQSTSQFVQRLKDKFLKEAKNIAKFDHPNIIKIHAAFEENNTAYYVMDFIEGESLSGRVKRTGPLPRAEALAYISRVGRALEYVHSFRMNHLDVKPANIMVRRHDNCPILIDFGLSKQYDSKGQQTSTTPVGISHGYAPMEQYNDGGVREFSPATDEYSLAATLYYLLSGITPPQATRMIEDDLVFPESVPSDLVPPIAKAMASARKNRYPTVGQFLSAVNVGNDSTDETDISDREHPKPEPAPKPQPALHPTPSPKPEPSKLKGWLVAGGVALVLVLVAIWQPWRPTPVEPIDEDSIVSNPVRDADESPIMNDDDNDNHGSYTELPREDDDDQRISQPDKQPDRSTTGTINGHEWVDLGLSVKWATKNVGALSPSDYGNYYAWGETTTKSSYTIANCKTWGKNKSDISGNSQYDAARANWGSSWRLPTKAECIELSNKCTWEWTSQGGHNGYRVTSKTNGNSIFVPAAGWRDGTSLYFDGVYGSYWSSTPLESNTKNAYYLDFVSSDHGMDQGYPDSGHSVRPVSE